MLEPIALVVSATAYARKHQRPALLFMQVKIGFDAAE